MPSGVPTVHRKTAHRWSPNSGVHYITFSCYQRLPLLGNPRIRAEFALALAKVRDRHRFQLIAWVAMPEHVHLMLLPTAAPGHGRPADHGAPVWVILQALKRPFAARVIERWRQLRWNNLARVTDSRGDPHFWQPGGGFDRNVRDECELVREVRYIHQNPVKRGLVDSATDWDASSARWYAGINGAFPTIDRVVIDQRQFPGPNPERYLG